MPVLIPGNTIYYLRTTFYEILLVLFKYRVYSKNIQLVCNKKQRVTTWRVNQ